MKHFYKQKPLSFPDYNCWEHLASLDLQAFPIVEDFEVRTNHTKAFGLHLCFFSESFGELASFPWWDRMEKKLPKYTPYDIPVGTLQEPWDDVEQGWRLIIFQHQSYVYVLQGDDPSCTEFIPWFRVPHHLYYEQWLDLIAQFNHSIR